jgi:putative ABC transport system ATP-binding protein
MIVLKQVCKTYDGKSANNVRALKQVSLHIQKGEMTAIIGKSGAGKTTLLNVIGCIDSPDEGTYQLNGTDISRMSEKQLASIRNTEIGIVMQNFALVMQDTALENVIIPFYFQKRIHLKTARQKALAALQSVGLESMASKPVNKLSGGQKQRVAIARAIVNEPSVILADEPTGALDSRISSEIMGIFKSLHAQGKTIMIVTHDMGIAKQCERIITISDGMIKEEL